MLVVSVIVAVLVIARMGGTPGTAATAGHRSSTTGRHGVASTTSPRGTSTTTTVPATTTTTLPPSSVLVLVLNGWSTRHAALFFKDQLAKYGYDLRVPVDAATSDNKASLVFYEQARYEPTALAIAQQLGIPTTGVVAPSATNDSALTTAQQADANVIVLVGEDISGKVPAGYSG